MSFDLRNRRVIVAGGSGGIGSAVVEALAESGARLSVCANNRKKLQAFATQMASRGHHIHAEACDVSEGDAVTRYVDNAVAALGGLDVVVNMISAFGSSDDEADWAKSFGVDLMSAVRLAHAGVVHMEATGGLIVHFASTAALHAAPRTPAYGAMKAAILHYTRTQAVALAKHKIRVNAIAPGSIDMPGGLWDDRKRSDPDLYRRTVESIPLGAMGAPQDVAGAVLFLASEHGRWITG